MNDISDAECSDMIEANFYVWTRLSRADKRAIATWWNSEWDQAWEEIDADNENAITDSELVQYLTEEGYILK